MTCLSVESPPGRFRFEKKETSHSDTHHDEGLVADVAVSSGVSQALKDVQTFLDGLQEALQVAEFLLEPPQDPALFPFHTV